MAILYLNLSMVFTFSLMARFASKKSRENSLIHSPNKYLIFLAASSLIIVSGLRNNIGDTYYYMHSYENFPITWRNIDFTGDFGFNLFQMLLQQITADPQIMIFLTALLTNALIVITIYNYSRFIEVSLYVYITLGYFLVSMNGVRQYLAAAILFIGTKFIIEGRFKEYLMVVLLAATFHQTALIMIPIYFIVRFPAWSKATYILLSGAVLLVLGFNEFMNILFSAIENTKYGDYKDFNEGGANILRVAVSAAPVLLAFLGREKLKEMASNSDVIVNMSILSLLFMIISTQNWIFARFSIYFGLYQLILIAWIIKLFKRKDQKLVYYVILLSYFIYFYFEHVIALGVVYKSNYF
ncbi:EpsG family protein [Sutcliffiella horikoshii]|uniref:EpsG family protein n=1 Tax=Sutcliffiella horikoshii TaxID=79883 RepID=A0AA94WRX4_9BACI|nr:EpsG family protein [Sutcliffiella horikoshii]TYS60072.1 EpsG family protein [Sutcliffiella horikoshii]